jgi:phosphoglycolate phosphatase
MRSRAIHLIFDLDGTLVDSRPGILHSLQEAVRHVHPMIDPTRLEFKIGLPVRAILRTAFPDATSPELDRLEAAFRIAYDEQGWKLSHLYPGVSKVLEHLKEEGIPLYIVTYKPALPTSSILENTGITPYFLEVTCPDSRQFHWKDKVEGIRLLLDRNGIQPGDAIYLGDSMDDLSSAQACGLAFIGLEYGYGSFPDQPRGYSTVSSFDELPMTILNLVESRFREE